MDDKTLAALRRSLDAAGFTTGVVTHDHFALIPARAGTYRTVADFRFTMIGATLPTRDFINDAACDLNSFAGERKTDAVRFLNACLAAGVDPRGWPMLRGPGSLGPWTVTIPGTVL